MIAPEEQLHRDVLEKYLFLRHTISRALVAKQQGGDPSVRVFESYRSGERPYVGTDKRDMLPMIERLLREAHLFEFHEALYQDLYIAIDRYTCEMQGLSYDGGLTDPTKFFDAVNDAADHISLPEHLPFDVCYFGWGKGIEISDVQHAIYRQPAYAKVYSCGHIISHDYVGELLVTPREGKINLITHFERDKGWNIGYSLMPWLVVAVINAINANSTLIRTRPRSLWDRNYAKKRTGGSVMIGGAAIPAAYYSVPIRPTHVIEQIKKLTVPGQRAECPYRRDRRGHFRHRIHRGKLEELTDEVREDFADRKYKIAIGGMQIDGELAAILLEHREPPPRIGEYVAVLRYFVRDTIVGRKELPYVPSTRRLGSDSRRPEAPLRKTRSPLTTTA